MRAKINQGLLFKQFAKSGKTQTVITLEPSKQAIEKGLSTCPLKLRLVRYNWMMRLKFWSQSDG